MTPPLRPRRLQRDSQGSSAAGARGSGAPPLPGAPPAAPSPELGQVLWADSGPLPGQAALPGALGPLVRWRRVEGPVRVLAGQGSDLVCCCVSAELDVVASVSRSRGLLLHSIMGGRVLRCLPHLRGRTCWRSRPKACWCCGRGASACCAC